MRTFKTGAAAALALVLFAGTASQAAAPKAWATPSADAGPAYISAISGFAFEDTITVDAGQSVTWANVDAVTHTVTADDGSWDSGEIPGGKSFTVTFAKPGTYRYHCRIHPAMQGVVVVRERT